MRFDRAALRSALRRLDARLRPASPYGPEAVTAALVRLGVRRGGVLLVHVGFSPEHAFEGGPADLIAAFRAAIGDEGTLCMMSMPFSGQTAHAYLTAPDTRPFDVRRTVSKVGLVTEVFRRQKGVRRLLHPTHPVCAQGPLAERLCADVAEASPFGPGGFFGRLLEVDAQMLLFGVGFERLTFEHFLEDRLGNRLGFPVYGETLPVPVIDATGAAREMPVATLSPALARSRRTWRLEALLRLSGRLVSTRMGRTPLHLCAARPVTEVVDRAARYGWRFHTR